MQQPTKLNQPIVHIDNSNIYIEGGKTYPSGPNQNPVADPWWRYKVSRLRQVLCYNSGPQFDPTVELAAYTNIWLRASPWRYLVIDGVANVLVHAYNRSSWTAKEKQVDMSMGVDITEQAMEDRFAGIQSEFIIVTGDGDLCPAVEKINKNVFRAHVRSWRKTSSSAFQERYNEHGRQIINLHYLVNFKDQSGYQASNPSTKPCRWGKYCWENDCRFFHSQDDQAYFAHMRAPNICSGTSGAIKVKTVIAGTIVYFTITKLSGPALRATRRDKDMAK